MTSKAERIALVNARRIEVRAEFFAYEEEDVLALVSQFQHKLKRHMIKVNRDRKLREKEFDDQIKAIEAEVTE